MVRNLSILLLVFLSAGLFWVFYGWKIYADWGNSEGLENYYKTAAECLYKWENVRRLQTVRRPGSRIEDKQLYTAIYYEQVYDAKNREYFIALYDGSNPKLDTCQEKLDHRYGSPNKLEAKYPPIAMTIYEGDFVLQTTDDPKGGVPLEKLPLLFGPLDPIVTKK
jgi:hypothetical protein